MPVRHHRLIATQSTVIADVQGSVGIAPALAVRAEAAPQVWAKAIREGSYASQFTSVIPVHQVRGLSPAGRRCTPPSS
ncbi:hypothetical protein [Pseudomonas chlororaphis]|uniref:hypothetical protein n=1 Tax=Pseudomonas chlororaphis TaxID=587753 RepID=UPI0012DAC46C|nr:hypothetical protein [Pseudomonas chlororaphis]